MLILDPEVSRTRLAIRRRRTYSLRLSKVAARAGRSKRVEPKYTYQLAAQA